MTYHREHIAILFSLLLGLFPWNASAEEVHLLVDTTAGTLTVMNGNTELHTFEDISIGRFGVTNSKRQGDNRTPLGTFRVGWITAKTRYHRFIGLAYPNLEIASEAFYKGLITKKEYLQIRRAEKAGEVPPQTTILGGLIGIHGIGKGDQEVHHALNWTNGCIALTNEEMDALLTWISVGTLVEIRQ